MNLAARLKPAHLRLILKIAESGKLQTAAAALAISQPAASRILSDIEREIGAPLFLRHPKGMEPSPIGIAIVRHAQVILGQFDNLQSEVAALKSGLIGEVRVGSVTGPAVGILVPAIRRVKADSPDIQATIQVGPSTQLVRGLDEGLFDFVIARVPPDHDSREFLMYPARTETVSMVVHKDHPLAGSAKVRLEELQPFEWVIQERGSPIRQAVDGAFHARGLRPSQKITNTSSLIVALASLEQTDAIAPQTMEVADLLIRNKFGTNLAKLQLAEKITVSPYFIIRNRAQQLPPAATRVLDEVLKLL